MSVLINADGEEENWRPVKVEPLTVREVTADGADGAYGRPSCRCPVCGRDCFKMSALQKHLRIHSGERPFVCPTCGRSFTQHVHMTEHQRTHSGEKPYSCSQCGKSFSRALDLSYHEGVHAEDRPYFCHVCHKSLGGARVFRKHMKRHEEARCSESVSAAMPQDQTEGRGNVATGHV
ncbi:gastrula zinc finger protein XlCGF9.1-like [Synchiropus splendidus]|uniref:gastrula zinc finger protein XlCGF9.1-like n=1 Tax=Synchiropus splendidus TaxID=270530 RepID=UPI00237D90D7|nr:gastrula zinc finger protein XlCGF9.1-like [Synchiropus splendidus]